MLSVVPAWIKADRGYASHAVRGFIWTLGARPAVPAKRNEAAVACPSWSYQNRNLAETRSVCGWRRAPLGAAQGVAGRGNPLRKDRLLLRGRVLHGRNHGLDQVTA